MVSCKKFLIIILLPFLLNISCAHSGKASSKTAIKTDKIPVNEKIIVVNSGSVMLRIHGEITETNPGSPTGVNESVTRNESINLSKGKKYTFSVMPAETITINVRSSDSEDAEITVYGYKYERKYSIKGTSRTGHFLAFQNIAVQ